MKRGVKPSLTMTGLVLGMAWAAMSHADTGAQSATLRAVTFSCLASGDELFLRIEGAYSFRKVQGAEDAVYVDLKSVRMVGVASSGHLYNLPGVLLTGYRLQPYIDAGRQAVVRVQLATKHPELFQAAQEAAGLRLLFGEGVAASASGTPIARTPNPKPRTPDSRATEFLGVSIQPDMTGKTLIDLSITRPMPYHVFELKDPARLVLDLEQARMVSQRRTYTGHSPLLRGVRVGQFRNDGPAVVRVVADLSGDPIFKVHAQPGGLRIELESRGSVAAVYNRREESALTERRYSGPSAGKSDGALPVGTTQAIGKAVSATQAQPVAAVTVAGGTPALPAKAAHPTEVAKISASEIASLASASVGSLQPQASPQGDPAGGAPDRRSETAATEQQAKYAGERISLNLKDVDLKDFFRLIHEVSGLNVMVDPNVTGSLTLVMDQVPWDQALDLVLRTNGLAKVLEGNVLRIARSATLTAEQESALKLADVQAEATPLVTVYRPVNYAKASTLAALLKSWVGGGALSRRGNVLVDERTNMLIISDIQPQIPIIESVITKLDKKSSQISIEARIVRANSDFARTLSTVLSAAQRNPSGSTQAAGATGTGITGTASTAPPLPPTPLFNQPPSASATGFGVYAITNASRRYLINAAIAAAETRDQAKIISAPTIVTQNNVAGTVLQGTKIPVQTVINNTVTTVYVDATLTLKVTPQVTDDGNIFLDLNVQNASPGAVLSIGAPAPSINTQQATTQVLVPDGGTVVFGGVKVTNRTRAVTQVPILGSIPILGNLFKSSNVTDNDQELLFFITPKVMPG